LSFITQVDGVLAGAVLCGHDGRRGYIHHLAVHPQFRRLGIGAQLVDQCLNALREAHIQKCHLFIFNSNENGIAFWKAVGWTPRSDIRITSKSIEQFIEHRFSRFFNRHLSIRLCSSFT
jgi:ribosomal protein S18 acetylase RimI-like enzyme